MTHGVEQLASEIPLPVDSHCKIDEYVWRKQNLTFVVLNVYSNKIRGLNSPKLDPKVECFAYYH